MSKRGSGNDVVDHVRTAEHQEDHGADPDTDNDPAPADPNRAAEPDGAGAASSSAGAGVVLVGPESPNATPRPRLNPRYLALLRIDVEALRRGGLQGQELCEITGVGPVPVSVARELLGDAIVKLIITRGVDVLNVTHLGRGPTVAQRVALL